MAKEEEQARILVERAELARLRAEQEARDKEIKQKREPEEAKARAEREAEEKRIADERAKLEADRKAEAKKVEEQRKDQERIEVENRRKKTQLEKQRQEQEEQARLLSERRMKLMEARRDTPTKALQDILALAENIADHPDHQKVRAEIAIIAESNLLEPMAQKKKPHREKSQQIS